MSLILHIDTASENAHTSFAKNGVLIDYLINESQKDHAGFLQTAIRKLATKNALRLSDIDAVAVTSGPGSYTGLRVGMASAKGICYALKIPLITMSTLELLTLSVFDAIPQSSNPLYCPMIDARRMEVFTAIYDKSLNPVLAPGPLILQENSYEAELKNSPVLFFGSGSTKWEKLNKHVNARFESISILPEAMSKRAYFLFTKNKFTELAYSEPMYLKDFQIVTPK